MIAIAGTPDKCQWLESELGVEKALNYRSPDFKEEFRKVVGGVDVYFDNVGGDILDLTLSRLNQNARVIMCGTFECCAYKESIGVLIVVIGAISEYSELTSQQCI